MFDKKFYVGLLISQIYLILTFTITTDDIFKMYLYGTGVGLFTICVLIAIQKTKKPQFFKLSASIATLVLSSIYIYSEHMNKGQLGILLIVFFAFAVYGYVAMRFHHHILLGKSSSNTSDSEFSEMKTVE